MACQAQGALLQIVPALSWATLPLSVTGGTGLQLAGSPPVCTALGSTTEFLFTLEAQFLAQVFDPRLMGGNLN